MLNNYVLVGRLKEIREEEKATVLTIVTPQTFKNIDGLYDNNYFDVRTYGNIAESTKKYCKKGDIIGIKVRLQKLENESNISIIAEKITFLSSRKAEDGE